MKQFLFLSLGGIAILGVGMTVHSIIIPYWNYEKQYPEEQQSYYTQSMQKDSEEVEIESIGYEPEYPYWTRIFINYEIDSLRTERTEMIIRMIAYGKSDSVILINKDTIINNQ